MSMRLEPRELGDYRAVNADEPAPLQQLVKRRDIGETDTGFAATSMPSSPGSSRIIP